MASIDLAMQFSSDHPLASFRRVASNASAEADGDAASLPDSTTHTDG
jgi:hypothetical protein